MCDVINQDSSNLVLEGRCHAEFSYKPLSSSPTCDFLVIPKTFVSLHRCVSELEINSAGHWPSRARFEEPYYK